MGASLGHAMGSTEQSTQSDASNKYSSGQTSLQDSILKALGTFIPGLTSGVVSPNVTNLQTAGADQINKTSSGLGDRMQRFLAQRGFGKSGTSGKVALSTELGRESALGANASAASGLQLQQNSGMLSDALKAAFETMGSSGSASGASSSSGTTMGVGFKIPGFG